jgi:hypothetical protein
MKFVGIDLTSAFARKPRAIDVAILDEDRNCRFVRAQWPSPEKVTGRDPVALGKMLSVPIDSEAGQVWAIDGPQGLAAVGQKTRHCERVLGTPGHSPDMLPPAVSGRRPFGDYIRSSVDLFAALLARRPVPQLAGLGSTTLANASLYEIFPGSDWIALAGRRLPKKNTVAGRISRRALLSRLGIQGLPKTPTADENDAAVGAYLAWCTRHAPDAVCLRGLPPVYSEGELREGYILHAAGGSKAIAMPDDYTSFDATPDPAHTEDWASSESLTLKLIDYGLVHGSCPENSWMQPGSDYSCEGIGPNSSEGFQLTHSASFSGGRGWRSEPTVKELLRRLGYPVEQALSKQDPVTLRLKLLC